MSAPLNVSFVESNAPPQGDALVVPVFADGSLGSLWEQRAAAGDANAGYIKTQIGLRGFAGKTGQTQTLTAIHDTSGGVKDIVLLGAGKKEALDEKAAAALAGPLSKSLAAIGARSAVIMTELSADTSLSDDKFAAILGDALVSKAYRFDSYRTVPDEKSRLESVRIGTADTAAARQLFTRLNATTDSALWVTDIVNQPANDLNPETYEKAIREKLQDLPIKITVLQEDEMRRLGMNLAVAVGHGSNVPPRMIVLEYDGSQGQQERPLALIGKGITFDNGGISIKPAADMGDMKMDMGGSAAMLGAIRALALRGAKTNVVAVLALAENSVSSTAYRPGDIYKSMNGKTVHIDNTDAEGRLVLADAMTYAQRTFKPHTVIDAATLTGAIILALGHEYAGLFANNDKLAAQLEDAGKKVDEKVWRMPLTKTFNLTDAKGRADLTNSGIRDAGASRAAGFLREFVEKDAAGEDAVAWAHLDIAGTAIVGNIGTGYGVRLLDRLIADHYEVAEPVAPKPVATPQPL